MDVAVTADHILSRRGSHRQFTHLGVVAAALAHVTVGIVIASFGTGRTINILTPGRDIGVYAVTLLATDGVLFLCGARSTPELITSVLAVVGAIAEKIILNTCPVTAARFSVRAGSTATVTGWDITALVLGWVVDTTTELFAILVCGETVEVHNASTRVGNIGSGAVRLTGTAIISAVRPTLGIVDWLTRTRLAFLKTSAALTNRALVILAAFGLRTGACIEKVGAFHRFGDRETCTFLSTVLVVGL